MNTLLDPPIRFDPGRAGQEESQPTLLETAADPMCGRFTFATPSDVVVEFFGLKDVPALDARYNIAPTQSIATIVTDSPTSTATGPPVRRLRPMRWGLIPPWARDVKIGSRLINARAETLAQKPSFRSAFQRRRCLIPADGFYEWKKLEGRKQPYHIRMRDGGPFAFAGLWERWRDSDGATIESCVIITTQPNQLLAELHNRMPVILPRNAFETWLDPGVQDTARVATWLVPFHADHMSATPVRTVVNSPAHDGPECVEPIPAEYGRVGLRVADRSSRPPLLRGD